MNSPSDLTLVVDTGGIVRCVYSENIDLKMLGSASLHRASHVEPDESGRWWADLGPVNGPRLGPFDHRSQALSAEQGWLEAHWLCAAL